MLLIDELAEARIAEAVQRGDFDNLPGAGRPLVLDDDSNIPETQRMAYRVLKNAGCLPPELQLRKDIDALSAAMRDMVDETEFERARRRLQMLTLRLSLSRGGQCDLRTEQAYFEKIQRRWAEGGSAR